VGVEAVELVSCDGLRALLLVLVLVWCEGVDGPGVEGAVESSFD
jgi:hypothetical protein